MDPAQLRHELQHLKYLIRTKRMRINDLNEEAASFLALNEVERVRVAQERRLEFEKQVKDHKQRAADIKAVLLELEDRENPKENQKLEDEFRHRKSELDKEKE